MGKVQFYDRLPFILIFSTAFLPSGMASTKDDPVHNEVINMQKGVSFQAYDENYSMKIKFANNYETFADLLWNKMKNEENAVMLSDDQFFDGKALINLPFGIQLFDLNVTRVAVTKEGTILSADPSANWTIAPLNAKSGMSRCNISYLIKDKNLYVRWNNFRFSHMYYFKQYEFSFQVRLGDRGDIDFVYRRVPYNLLNFRIHCDCLGDKFGVMYSRQEEFKVPPFKETYELGYSMDLEKCKVKDGTVARFSPADKCMFQKNCYDCTKTQFHINASETARCSWCPAIEKCSSTRDSLRHVWKENTCNIFQFNDPIYCYTPFKGDSEFYYYLTAEVILIAAILCIKFGGAAFCCNKPSVVIPFVESLALLELANQQNQSDDSNPAETQNN